MKRTPRPRPPVTRSGVTGFLKTERTASVVTRGHAFVQNLRRGHYELALDSAQPFRLAPAFEGLRPAV